ncbi:hypothetical protein EYF80_058669 [Liparis tanakae]|uniref:Uncharacterized protein n=1 Tax=Liparis tanakae TaxID=230148 RepID=A0A4Z2ERE6_9TELE|nr:hypothetical protein EYF80_058669 [Liparis tanakae]
MRAVPRSAAASALFSESFTGGLDWTVLAGKQTTGKSSDRLGGGDERTKKISCEENARAARPTSSSPTRRRSPDVHWKRPGRCEALWESSRLGDMPLEEGGVAMPHNEEGLHRGSFPPEEELRSPVELWEDGERRITANIQPLPPAKEQQKEPAAARSSETEDPPPPPTFFDGVPDDLTCRLEVCGLRGDDCVPEKGGRDRGGASGCRGVENGVEEELPVAKGRQRRPDQPSHGCTHDQGSNTGRHGVPGL